MGLQGSFVRVWGFRVADEGFGVSGCWGLFFKGFREFRAFRAGVCSVVLLIDMQERHAKYVYHILPDPHMM